MELEEKLELLRGLQPYGNMYYTFLNMSYVQFSDSVPTLGVSATDESREHILLTINPTFWSQMNKLQKLFLISHECMHVMLSHLPRLYGMLSLPEFNKELMNIAADLSLIHI